MPTISAAVLETFATNLLAAGGASAHEARRTAEGLISANLRGYDSHGVMRIPYYVDAVARGDVVSGAQGEVLHETETLLAVDARWSFGHVCALDMLEKLMAKADAHGIGVGTLKHAGHIGRLGEYAEIAAARGLVSMLMVNSHGAVHRVAPPGGKASRLGTNPLCIGSPCGDAPLVLDFSTSATAEGKVRVNHIAKKPVPEGLLIDSDGRPTTDPASLYASPPGSILPFGGPQAYKAFGLSLMIEVLTGALSGGLCSREKAETPLGNCVFMLVLNPAQFGGAECFSREVEGLAKWVQSCPPVEGVQRILLPGDPERAVLARRLAEGITLDDGNWAKLVQLAEKLHVSLPDVKS